VRKATQLGLIEQSFRNTSRKFNPRRQEQLSREFWSLIGVFVRRNNPAEQMRDAQQSE